jgi:hypothetical protein
MGVGRGRGIGKRRNRDFKGVCVSAATAGRHTMNLTREKEKEECSARVQRGLRHEILSFREIEIEVDEEDGNPLSPHHPDTNSWTFVA